MKSDSSILSGDLPLPRRGGEGRGEGAASCYCRVASSEALVAVIYFVFIAAGLLLTGCLSRPPTVNARHFVLAPTSTNELAPAAAKHLSVGIGFVKMPSYLLRKSMAVRNGANEIGYNEDAQWAERLDQCFQRIVAANLSRLLPSANIYPTDWPRDQETIKVFIDIQQLDVDSTGNGNLNAHWRITASDSDRQVKTGQSRLTRTGASPRGHPEVIATTLSDLTAEFSRDLAQSIRESVK
jgi:uncharacterized lipoprotein YmbA